MSECKTEMVDAAEAKRLRQTANFELQRPMSESNILRLEAEMKAGRFVRGTPIYFGILPDKSPIALNGNHTLEAVARCNTPIELTFIFQDVANISEAAAIYSRLDLHKRRSWRDMMRAYGKEEMIGESTKWTSALSSSLRFLFEKFRVARNDNERELAKIQALRSPDVMVQALAEAESAALRYLRAIGDNSADPSLYKRASVMAVGVEIMRYQAAKGHDFFSSLSADDGLRAGDPQRALLRYLREHGAAGAVAREAMAKAVAVAWNAFYEGRKLDIVKPGAMRDFRIEGTPWVNPEFDPLRVYLPELFAAPEEPTLILTPEPETIEPKARRGRRRIQTGIDVASNRPVAIFDREPEPASIE